MENITIITKRQNRVQGYLDKLLARKVKFETGAYDSKYQKEQQASWALHVDCCKTVNKDPMIEYDLYHKGVRCVPVETLLIAGGFGKTYDRTDIVCESWEMWRDIAYCELLGQIHVQKHKLAKAKQLDAKETAKLAKQA